MEDELNNSHNIRQLLKRLAKPLLVLVFIIFIIQLYIINCDTQKVPAVVQGDVGVFDEEFSKYAQISKVECDKNYIYILYSNMNAIAVYDMDGKYQQSFAFYDIPHAILQMRYDNGFLYVAEGRQLYIFENCRLLRSYEQTGTLYKPTEWYLESSDNSITISDGNVYNVCGDYIMALPGHF